MLNKQLTIMKILNVRTRGLISLLVFLSGFGVTIAANYLLDETSYLSSIVPLVTVAIIIILNIIWYKVDVNNRERVFMENKVKEVEFKKIQADKEEKERLYKLKFNDEQATKLKQEEIDALKEEQEKAKTDNIMNSKPRPRRRSPRKKKTKVPSSESTTNQNP